VPTTGSSSPISLSRWAIIHSRCNVAYASFDLREDFEALLNETKEPNQTELEARLRERSREVLDSADDPMTETRDLVEATVIEVALDELGVAEAAD